jgi:hypothetical protein
MSDYLNVVKIAKEPGIGDLKGAARAKFAKAVKMERVAGHTTPEALQLLDEAIAADEVQKAAS